VQAAENVISIDDVMQAALDNSTIIGEVENSSAFTKADASDRETLSNPQLELSYGIPTTSLGKQGRDEFDIALEQPIRLSDGSLRNRLARLMYEAGNTDREKAILELFVQVKLAYARVWVLSERKRTLIELSKQATTFSEAVKVGAKAGAYAEAEALVFAAEVSKLKAELKGVEAEMFLAHARLSQIVGRSFVSNVLKEPILAKLSIKDIEEKLKGGALKVQSRLSLIAELAIADAAVANRDAFPEFRPKLFYSKANDGIDILGVGLSFDLPFYSQNSVERIKKDSVERNALNKLKFFSGDVFKTSVVNSLKAYGLRREQVALYQDSVMPNLKSALTGFESQLKVGRGDVFSLWQTLREYFDTNQHYLELWTTVFSEHCELSLLLEEEI
jgi:outer membrane protein TolC